MTVGQKIRFFRDLRGYTQAELGVRWSVFRATE